LTGRIKSKTITFAAMEILSAHYIKSSPGYKDCPEPDRPEYAFIGRSNVGKSTLINMITGKKNLAKISSTPGKTQLINHFEILPHSRGSRKPGKSWYLVDLPGYGYAKVSQKARHNWDNMIESYIRKRPNLVCLFVLIDSRHSPQEADLEFINQLGEWEIPFVFVFTKTDKNKPGQTEKNIGSLLQTLAVKWEESPPYFISSSVKQSGRKEILEYIDHLNSGYTSL
jgi:GTP-binding protein